MPGDITFALPVETLTAHERLPELATILVSVVACANPWETNENSPLDGYSSPDTLALKRRRRRQARNRAGDG